MSAFPYHLSMFLKLRMNLCSQQTIAEDEEEVHIQVPEPTEREKALHSQVSELQSQLASLNSKLVGSFQRVGDLEDQLEHDKEMTLGLRNKVNELETLKSNWERKMEGGLLVEKVCKRFTSGYKALADVDPVHSTMCNQS